jgi:hypothetical protein
VKHNISQQRFDLNTDDEREKKLDDFLKSLANHGRKKAWIVRALLTAFKERGNHVEVE